MSVPPTRRRRKGNDYPYGIIGNGYDPVIWGGANEPPAHKKFIEDLKKFTGAQYASGWSVVGYESIYALAAGVKKAGDTKSDDVSKALEGLTWDTPVGKRTFSVESHETFSPQYWGTMVEEAAYAFAIMKDPELLPTATN
jgi:ABC-type branched-subunit amino acid transport system substrate-binding protein